MEDVSQGSDVEVEQKIKDSMTKLVERPGGSMIGCANQIESREAKFEREVATTGGEEESTRGSSRERVDRSELPALANSCKCSSSEFPAFVRCSSSISPSSELLSFSSLLSASGTQ